MLALSKKRTPAMDTRLRG